MRIWKRESSRLVIESDKAEVFWGDIAASRVVVIGR